MTTDEIRAEVQRTVAKLLAAGESENDISVRLGYAGGHGERDIKAVVDGRAKELPKRLAGLRESLKSKK
jgi:hypothetical protein